ncbi:MULTISPECIES: HNH endonuclease family protein [Actinomyces]|uniref:Deoxyribonuclease n=1 Tax=Actinomyces oris TaxID=544580 RepID=A0A1Q8VQB6_9ACTO|nr:MULTISPECIES: HNH endonuclease family protein [Actinomyces]OLO50275.1 deoxyribonuclease [Actinomyces oris]
MNASGRILAHLSVLGALSMSGMTAALPVHADETSPAPSPKSTTSTTAELAALHEAPWDRRGDFILSPSASLEALSELPEDAPAARSWAEGGSRTGWFGEAWTDVDGDGCDTRNEILARDLTDADFSRADGVQPREEGRGQGAGVCPDATVWAGALQDPYTGRRITFTRGQETSAAVQIDHVVPLNYLYAHGAWQWDERTRLLAANDPLNLVAVEGEANQAKGACGPASCPVGSTETGSWRSTGPGGWWPANASYRCIYARRFVSVAAAYRLGLPQTDKDALRSTLDDCLAGGDGTVSLPEQATRTAKEIGSVVWRSPGYSALTAFGALVLGWGLILRGRRRGRRASRRRSRSMSRY